MKALQDQFIHPNKRNENNSPYNQEKIFPSLENVDFENVLPHLSNTNETKLRYKCFRCNMQCNGESHLKAHERSHKRNAYHCSECNFETNDGELFRHHKKDHLKLKIFNCNKCKFRSDVVSFYHEHKCVTEGVSKTLKENPLHNLQKQNERLMSQSHNAVDETLNETIVKRLRCMKCKFETRSKGSLRLHSAIHGDKPFSCFLITCDYKTPFKRLLEMHQQRHQALLMGSEQFKCPHCSFQTHRRPSLERHSLIHSHEKDSQSSQCPRDEGHHTDHKKDHLSPKIKDETDVKYSCLYCEFCTNSEPEFSDHLLSHNRSEEKVLKSPKLNDNLSIQGPEDEEQDPNKIVFEDVLNHSKRKVAYTAWPIEEKLEIYWCDIYSRHGSFFHVGLRKRRRNKMLERGIIDKTKVKNTNDARFDAMISHINNGRTKNITVKIMQQIAQDVEEHMNAQGPGRTGNKKRRPRCSVD